jgi:hypothetical protein
LKKAEKSGVIALPSCPGWYEIRWNVLKKRLKQAQEGLARLRQEWENVNLPGLSPRKDWEFLGSIAKGTIMEIPELRGERDEARIETPGKCGWRSLGHAEREMKEALDADLRVMLNHRGVYDQRFDLEPGDCVHVNNPLQSARSIIVWDLTPFASILTLEETQNLLKRRLGWIHRGRISLLRNEEPWSGWDISGASTLRFVWKGKITCRCEGEEIAVWVDQVQDWIKANGDQRVTRNNMPWDEKTILPGDTFEIHQRQRGGSSPKKCRDPFSVKNFNPRIARRKRVEAAARALRVQHQKEEELEESIRWKSTSITYEGEEFVTREFVKDEWNKQTARRFAKWVRSFSGLERWNQKIVDVNTNEEHTEIQGKTLILLNPDEVWESGQVMLKRKPIKKGPWKEIRTSPIRVFLRKREGCIWKDNEKKTFTGRIVLMLQKGDVRKSISLFEEDHQGIRVQPGWLGISFPRGHMGETPSRKGWWQIYWNQKFIEQAGRIKKGLDHTRIKSPAEFACSRTIDHKGHTSVSKSRNQEGVQTRT